MDEVAHETSETGRKRPGRIWVTIVLAVLVLLTIGNYVSTAILFTLIKRHPAWLIGLDPTTRNLLLVANEMSLVSYFALSIVRRMLPHPLWFLIGRWYGDKGLRWVQRRSPDIGAMVDTLEEYFPRLGWLIVIIYPHPVVCVMAGASKMRMITFWFYALIGVVGFTWAARAFGDWLHPVTKAIADFGGHYWIPLTVLTVALVVGGFVVGEITGRSKIESINKIENELEGSEGDQRH